MGKLKKLFPLSFKYCKNVKSLILCAILYLLIEVAVGLVGGLVIEPMVAAGVGAILAPITVIGIFALILGFIFTCTGFGAIIGAPMMILAFPIMTISGTVTSLFMAVVYGFATIYTMVGCTVAVLAYAGVFGEITFPEKEEKKATEETPAIEE